MRFDSGVGPMMETPSTDTGRRPHQAFPAARIELLLRKDLLQELEQIADALGMLKVVKPARVRQLDTYSLRHAFAPRPDGGRVCLQRRPGHGPLAHGSPTGLTSSGPSIAPDG
jgi:hypothetical protein